MKKQNKPTVPRVLMVKCGSLLDEGVESLLLQEADLQVTGITYSDEIAFLQDVSHARPGAILLNEAGPLDSVRIFELLKDLPALATLRVIIIRPDDNTIDVYEKRRIIVARSGDLLALIRSGENTTD